MKSLIVCCVPEVLAKSRLLLVEEISECLRQHSPRCEITGYSGPISGIKLAEELREIAKYLSEPGRKAFVYYNGHGDQIRDRNGDEADGKDEIWKPGGAIITDDEITSIFSSPRGKGSTLFLVSDSCSSGSMIDSGVGYATISSCNDSQDSLSTVDGGVFSMFGLIPALRSASKNVTPRELFNDIKKRIEIPSQTITLHSSGIEDEPIF